MQVRREVVAQALALASGDLDIIPRRSEVPDDGLRGALRRSVGTPERATNEGDGDGVRLGVLEGEEGLRRVPVDELHAEDLGLREGGRDFDGELGAREGNVVALRGLDLVRVVSIASMEAFETQSTWCWRWWERSQA